MNPGKELALVFLLLLLASLLTLLPPLLPEEAEKSTERLEELRRNWVRLGPPGGHVPQIIFSRENASVIYAGLDDDQGLYKSTDGGESWKLISRSLRDISAGTLAVHPENEDVILLGDSFYGKGLYKSTDGGHCWDYKGFRGRFFNFRSIAVSPTRPDTVYLGLGRPWFLPDPSIKGDLFKSEDFGETWEKITPPEPPPGAEKEKREDKNAWYIQVDARDAHHVYVAIYGAVYVTRDGGTTWEETLALPEGARGVIALAADPNLSKVAYAGIGQALLKTSDGGTSWTRINRRMPAEFTVFANWPGLFVSPHDSHTLYAGMPPLMSWPLGPMKPQPQGIFRSVDGGRVWRRIDQGYDGNSLLSITVSPYDPNILFLGTEGRGILRSDDGGVTWNYKNEGLLSAWVTSLAIDPRNPDILYTGVADGHAMDNSECFKSTDGGKTWEYKRGKRYDVWTQWIVDPDEPAIVYGAGGGAGLAEKSVDGGNTWKVLHRSDELPYRVSLEINETDPRVLYAGGKNEIWKTTNKGATWNRLEREINFPLLQWDAIAIVPGETSESPGRHDRLYVATEAGILFSHDGGETWTRSGPADRVFTAIAAHRPAGAREDVVYAGTFLEGLYASRDSGRTWRKLPADFQDTLTTKVLLHPRNPEIVFVCNATEAHFGSIRATPGLFLSVDEGKKWVELTPLNLPYSTIYSVAVHPQRPNVIYVASPGGILRLTLPEDFYDVIVEP